MKLFKKVIFSIFGMALLATGFVACSSDDSNVNTSAVENQNDEALLYEAKGGPVWPVIVALKVISEVIDGKYYKETEYNSDGSIRSQKEGCKGFLGTCSMPSTEKESSESLSLRFIPLDYVESGNSRLVNAELIKTDFGILYAINKNEYRDDCDFFFNSKIKDITGELIIDNPNILNKLKITEPIIVHGEYIVHENKDYKYIVIDE
ncbi:hypothetical protein [Avrilella dinanensis]|uniref:hypothetical protein n=1 Tax=Avrilella dinanensis TaxID=2008672 RepID=UPI00240A9097|nr:hypothetical protein [Avrilella dinanensis]